MVSRLLLTTGPRRRQLETSDGAGSRQTVASVRSVDRYVVAGLTFRGWPGA